MIESPRQVPQYQRQVQQLLQMVGVMLQDINSPALDLPLMPACFGEFSRLPAWRSCNEERNTMKRRTQKGKEGRTCEGKNLATKAHEWHEMNPKMVPFVFLREFRGKIRVLGNLPSDIWLLLRPSDFSG